MVIWCSGNIFFIIIIVENSCAA